jgi:hypothetical protein
MPVVFKNPWLLGAGVAPRIGGNGLMGKFEAVAPSRQWSVFAAVTQIHNSDYHDHYVHKYHDKYKLESWSSGVDETKVFVGASIWWRVGD